MSPELLKNLVSELLLRLDIEPTGLTVSTGHRTVVAITVEDTTPLVGPNGEHLRALNTLTKRLVEQKYGVEAASFLIDVNNYHENQMESVRAGARMLAQRARLFKHDVELEPMNPYERLVIHELFAEDPQIETRSEGEGKFRHVVLKFRDQKTA